MFFYDDFHDGTMMIFMTNLYQGVILDFNTYFVKIDIKK